MPRRFGLAARERDQLAEVSLDAATRRVLLSAAWPADGEAWAPLYGTADGEACAALYGTADGPVLRVGAWRRLANTEPGACFVISVADLLSDGGMHAAQAPGQPHDAGPPRRLVGLFHSHPHSDAVPSDLDCLAIARLPFVWAIAGGGSGPAGSLRFFTWSARGVRELAISLPASPPDPHWGSKASRNLT